MYDVMFAYFLSIINLH